MGGVLGALFLGWALGANDAASIYGPAVASRAVRYRTALVVAMVFVVLGACMGSARTLHTVGTLSQQTPRSALAITAAAALSMTVLVVLRLPSSSSQAVVGAIVGGAWGRGVALDAAALGRILQGWVLTPLVAAFLGFAGAALLSRLGRRRHAGFLQLDPLVRTALLALGAWCAFALGANNAANVSGVVVASGVLAPFPGAALAGGSIALGIASFGWRLVDLVGDKLVRFEPPTALVVMLAQALTVHLFALWGLPVSMSQALAGGALGIGLAKGVRTLGRRAFLHVLLGWVATPLAGGVLAYAFVHVL